MKAVRILKLSQLVFAGFGALALAGSVDAMRREWRERHFIFAASRSQFRMSR